MKAKSRIALACGSGGVFLVVGLVTHLIILAVTGGLIILLAGGRWLRGRREDAGTGSRS